MGLIVYILVVLFTLFVALLGVLYIYFQHQYGYWAKRNVFFAKPSFPFGNMAGKGKRRHAWVMIKDIYDEGAGEPFMGMYTFHRPGLMLRDPDLIKSVFVRDFNHFHDHGMYFNEKEDPLSAHLFNLEGSKWRRLRVKLTPTFTSGKMKMMFPIMAECSEELRQVLQQPAQRGEVIQVKEFIARLSTDIISSCAFGIQTNSLKNPDAIFRQMGKKILEPNPFLMTKLMMCVLTPAVAAFFKLVVTPKEVTDFFLGAMRETMEYREKNKVTRNDFLQLLIELINKGYVADVDHPKSETEGNTDEKFTFLEAAAQAFIFFQGGFESTSTVIQFLLYEISVNPEIQERCREEVRRVLVRNGGSMNYEAVHEMDYLGRVIDETLRKYPPVGAITRVCNKTYKIPDSDVVIEKGTGVFVSVYSLHMDPEYWPDPDKFDPDRFLPEQKQTRNNFAFLPFGEGPRICIGNRFGLMQIRTVVTMLLTNFKFEVCEKTLIPMELDPKEVFFTPKGGMQLRISML